MGSDNLKLILASASERRHELLKRITNNFDVIVSDFDESKVKFQGDCGRYVMELAKGKALATQEKVKENSIIIACDTIVSIDNRILGKPINEREAFEMLKALSGNIHQVYSGIAITDTITGKITTDYVITNVVFADISDEEIEEYISKGESMDKAGAYGIQGNAAIFVKEIHGCYYNVVGLPLNKLSLMLKEMGVKSI